MCLSKVFFDRDGEKELLMEEVASVEVEDDKLLFKTLFGEQKKIEGNIGQIDFMTHTITLRSTGK